MTSWLDFERSFGVSQNFNEILESHLATPNLIWIAVNEAPDQRTALNPHRFTFPLQTLFAQKIPSAGCRPLSAASGASSTSAIVLPSWDVGLHFFLVFISVKYYANV